MGRFTILAKGNLDLRDTLHAQRSAGAVGWNGVNALLRGRGVTARVRHETWTRSDALLAATGCVPPELAARDLDLGAYPAASQFSTAVFEPGPDVVALSIQPDALSGLARHRRDGWLFHPDGWRTWPQADQAWLREAFEPAPTLDPDQSMANFAEIIGRIRAAADPTILIYNLSAVVPGEDAHTFEGLGETLATRIRRFNLALVELSARTGVAIVDVDRIVAEGGATRLKHDTTHLTPEGCAAVAAEAVRVMDDLGVLERACACA